MGYTVDLDLLDQRIGQLEDFERSLDRALKQLETPAKQLDDTWTGLAAEAHRKAHRAWVRDAAEMRKALAGLREAARIAHKNYHGAATANLTMWESTQ